MSRLRMGTVTTHRSFCQKCRVPLISAVKRDLCSQCEQDVQEKINHLHDVTVKLPESERAQILAYLCGYCHDQLKFAEGLQAFMSSNYPDMMKGIRK